MLPGTCLASKATGLPTDLGPQVALSGMVFAVGEWGGGRSEGCLKRAKAAGQMVHGSPALWLWELAQAGPPCSGGHLCVVLCS